MSPSPTLQRKLDRLPTSPGVYRHLDANGKLLYVGKAKNLRNRVRSYFREGASLAEDKALMVSQIADVEWTVVDTELEALFLESTLIKRHKPPYNILLRDDKNFAFLKITDEPYPKVVITRKRERDGADYYGPFTSMAHVYSLIGTIKDVFTGFRYRSVKSTKIAPGYHCVIHPEDSCSGLCKGLIHEDDYTQTIERIRAFLSGRETQLESELTVLMESAAAAKNYEAAARWRDQRTALLRLQHKQRVISPTDDDTDYLGFAADAKRAVATLLIVRGGRLLEVRHFLLTGATLATPEIALTAFAEQYYLTSGAPPHQIASRYELGLSPALQEHLTTLLPGQKRIHTIHVKQGERMRLIELAEKNAVEHLAQQRVSFENRVTNVGAALRELAEALDIPRLKRIECYDISNVQGTNPVGSMIVFVDGKSKKSEYRRFHITSKKTPDDPRMMAEMLTRRLHEDWDTADLLLIDGGKSQLSVVSTALEHELGPGLPGLPPMVGLTKKEEVMIRPMSDGTYREIRLTEGSAGYFLIQRIRDEAHRLAITFHRATRSKRMLASTLDDIPGIGPTTRRKLLRAFGDLRGIRDASDEELAAVIGQAKAKQLRARL